MRDPRRIDEVIEVLRQLWYTDPELRLGQLICTMVPDNFQMDPFYCEDGELLKVMKQRLAKRATR